MISWTNLLNLAKFVSQHIKDRSQPLSQPHIYHGHRSVAPPTAPKEQGLRLSSSSCAFWSPPPPHVHRVGGRERPVSYTIRKHRWASSLSSFYSEFFVEKWSTKSSITRSPWYVVPSTPCKNAPRRSLLQPNLPSTQGREVTA